MTHTGPVIGAGGASFEKRMIEVSTESFGRSFGEIGSSGDVSIGASSRIGEFSGNNSTLFLSSSSPDSSSMP